MVACSTKMVDFGFRKRATLNNERQFQPSRPLPTSRMYCLSELGRSSALNSRMASLSELAVVHQDAAGGYATSGQRRLGRGAQAGF